MDYTITYMDLLNFKFGLGGFSGQLFEALSNIGQSFCEFVEMDSFQGAAAVSMKSYISEVSNTVMASFQVAMQELQDRYLFYKDGYSDIDSSVQFVLTEEKLRDLKQFFRQSDMDFDDQHQAACRAIEEVSDIKSFAKPRPYNVVNDYGYTERKVDELMTATGEYEETHAAHALDLFYEIIGQLKKFIAEYMGGRGQLSYQSGDIGQSPSIQGLCAALQTSLEIHAANAEALAAIQEREDARFAELEEIWARERAERGLLNLLVGALVVIGGAICIVATAGMATPFVVAGAISGTASIAYGYSNMLEARDDIRYGLAGDYSTAAINPLRDTVFAGIFGEEGKQAAWDTFGTAAIAATAVVSISAGAASAVMTAGRAGSSVTQAVVVYGVKTGLTFGAGMLGGWGGKELALELGANETVANIVGVLSGTAAGMAVGLGAQALDQKLNLSGYYTDIPHITNPDNAVNPNDPPDKWRADWNQAPEGGYKLDADGNPIKVETTPQKGDIFDRYGRSSGNYTSPVGDDGSFSFDSRSLPQGENPNALHRYEVLRNFDELPDAINTLPDGNLKMQLLEDYSNLKTYTGEVAPAFGQPGGAIQTEFPLSCQILADLGFIKDITPYVLQASSSTFFAAEAGTWLETIVSEEGH